MKCEIELNEVGADAELEMVCSPRNEDFVLWCEIP